MTEQDFCKRLEEMASYMKEKHPEATDLKIDIADGNIHFCFEDWDEPSEGYDFSNVKRREIRRGSFGVDGWHLNNGEWMNEYYAKTNVLKEARV